MNKYIEKTSKQGQRIAHEAAEHAYRHPEYTYSDIFDAYGKPSEAKRRAWDYCKRLCAELGGVGLRISSRNTFRFSAVFTFPDPETGVSCYAYITPDYNRFCEA